jgi:hypothetical protein
MSRSKKKPNSLNRTAIRGIREQIVAGWPSPSIVKGFFVEDPTPLGISETAGFRDVAVAAAGEISGDDVNVRIFRKPAADDTHDYDVDEIRGATGPVVTYASKGDIDRHHLKGTIPDNLMRRNNLTIVVVPDGEGGMKPDVRPDGLTNAFINFEDEPLR